MSYDSDLEAAEADLAEAERELAAAAQHVEAAEKQIEEILDRQRAFPIEVIYNGVPKPFEVRHEELVKTLLSAALAAFAPLPNPHTLSIWKGGDELKDDDTLRQSGVKRHDKLLLRPSKVKGGR